MKKIKGSVSAIKLRYIFIAFAISLVALLPLRVYQLLTLVETSSGFFAKNDFTVTLIYVAVAAFAVAFLIMSYMSSRMPSVGLPKGKNPVLAISALLAAVGFVYDIFKTAKDILPLNQTNPTVFMNLLKNNMDEKGGSFVVLGILFAFFSVVYFLLFAISHINGSHSYKGSKILALAPMAWAMTSLVTRLMRAISFVRVSELLFEIFAFVFLMLFFMAFARASSEVYVESCIWEIFGCGLSASLLLALITIPRAVVAVFKIAPVDGHELNFAHLGVLIFVVSYILATVGVGFKGGVETRKTVDELVLPDENATVVKKEFDEELEQDEK